jgi:hypothetical protein
MMYRRPGCLWTRLSYVLRLAALCCLCMDVSVVQQPVLPMDVSVIQKTVMPLDMSVL